MAIVIARPPVQETMWHLPPPSHPWHLFVVKFHVATHVHYDFRLEHCRFEDVRRPLASWAMPEGPSLDPNEVREATRVGDHRMSGFSFEGVHGPGYGAGPVLVWDWGYYCPVTMADGKVIPVGRALQAGRLTFELFGKKLRGRFTLRQVDGPEKWVLVKEVDDWAEPGSNITAEQPLSAKTGRTLAEVVADWDQSSRQMAADETGSLFPGM